MRTVFESQCDRISEELEKLSDWEMKFYMYCLLPRLADSLESGMDEEIKTPMDYIMHEGMRQIIADLRRIREALAYELF